MTNAQAQGYAVAALRTLLKDVAIINTETGKKITPAELCKALNAEMCWYMDVLSGEEAEEKASRILQGK